MSSLRTKVLLTVDTEFWPHQQYATDGDYRSDFERDVLGRTPAGDFGIGYQARLLADLGLTATFFVESLAVNAAGHEYLSETVDVLQDAKQDVQLHIHTEWQQWTEDRSVAGLGNNIHDFPLNDQKQLIAQSLEHLLAAGAANVCAYRAGNYGANLDTLTALASNGLRIDSSYNPAYLDRDCQMAELNSGGDLLLPTKAESMVEFPVSYARDLRGRKRHLQVCACSFSELKSALDQAHQNRWPAVTMVCHSHELIRGRQPGQQPKPDPTVIARFEGLCRFLSDNVDRFVTGPIGEDAETLVWSGPQPDELKAPPIATLRRFAEQAWRRVRP